MNEMSMMMLLMAALSGGSTEALDYMPTDAYWRTKGVEVTAQTMLDELSAERDADISGLIEQLGSDEFQTREKAHKAIAAAGPGAIDQLKPLLESEDAEVRERARQLIARLKATGQAPKIRRLMAIRTLGELKAKGAVKRLEKLAGTDEPFLGLYARRALAAIRGKAFAAPAPDAKALASDAWAMPSNIGLLAQSALRFGDGGPITFDKLELPGDVKIDPAAMSRAWTAQVLKVVEMAGNFRIDAATFALSSELDHDKGFLVLTLRGLYDPEAFKSAVGALGIEPTKIAGVDAVRFERQFEIVLLSPTRLVIVGGPREQKLPTAAVINAIKGDAAPLKQNKPLAGLIADADRSGLGWGAVHFSESYREADIVEPLRDGVAAVKLKEGSLDLKARFRGLKGREDAFGRAVDEFKEEVIDEGSGELRRMINRRPAMGRMLSPLLGFVESMKIARDGNAATLTGRYESPGSAAMLAPMLLMISPESANPPAEAVVAPMTQEQLEDATAPRN